MNNSKRIIKNTSLLYIRMLLTMGVSLYTSRIILNTLGVEDFGIYNVVGGFVIMFGFFNGAMASATQRFLSFEIGSKNHKQLKNVFSMSINIHIIIALIILLFTETIGLWFINTKLNIPTERMVAANWVYQFSVFSFIINVVSVPYNAIIIAHERMNIFATMSIIEVSLKLLIVFMLQWLGFDKLKTYAFLIFSVTLIIKFIYIIYCNLNFKESKYTRFWDKSLFKTLISYASWNLWGNLAVVLLGQGINILLNIFFGPTVNAARAIAYQVQGAISSFVNNFQMAMNPQIIKTFAANELKNMHQLIYQGAKYSFFLLLILSLPILLETEIILKVWLKIVPKYAIIFTQLVIINILIDTISGPLMTAAQASGKIKLYQGVVGGLLLLILPISYIYLKLGFSPEITIYVNICISIIALIARLIIISPLVNLSIKKYFNDVILKIVIVTIIAVILPILIRYNLSQGLVRFILVCCSSLFSITITIYFIGLNHKERLFLHKNIMNIKAKIKNA